MHYFTNESEGGYKHLEPEKAVWITAKGDGVPANSYFCFRAILECSGNEDLTVFLSAVNRYRLWVNGVFIGDGPSPSPSHYAYMDRHRLDASLLKQRTLICILVHYTGVNLHDQPALCAEVCNASGEVVLATSAEWEGQRCLAWNEDTYRFPLNWFDPWQEWFDARKMPVEWLKQEAPVFAKAVAITPAPKIKLYASEIPKMRRDAVRAVALVSREEHTALENRVRSGDLSIVLSMPGVEARQTRADAIESLFDASVAGPLVLDCALPQRQGDAAYEPSLLLDFGRVLKGCLEIEVEGCAGATLDFGFAEQLIDGSFNNSLECQFCVRYILREGRQVWRMFSWRAWRYLKLRLRYTGPVKIHRLEVIEENILERDFDAFRCEDSQLMRIFQMCRNTLALGCGELIMDTPWREQGQWLGDASAVTLDILMANSADRTLAAKFLREGGWNRRSDGLLMNLTNMDPEVGANKSPIPDYSLWWIRGQWLFYQETGREDLLKAFFSQVEAILAKFAAHADARGLVAEMPGWVFIDWAAVDRKGVCAPLNALYFMALGYAAQIADVLNQHDRAKQWRGQADQLAGAFSDAFWCDQRQCFADAFYEGRLSDTVSEHTNALALWLGLKTAEQRAQIVKNVFRQPLTGILEAEPFFTAFVLKGLDVVGEFDLALKIIRDRWGSRMADLGHLSALEEWSCLGSWRDGPFKGFLRSQSHVWSAAPAHFLVDNLIGLRILEAGGSRVSIKPHLIDSDYRIHRMLGVGWLKVACVNGRFEVESSADVQVQFAQGSANTELS